MIDEFIQNKTIVKLNLLGTRISNALIAKLTTNNTTMTHLNLCLCNLQDQGLETIAQNKMLKDLSLPTNNIAVKRVEYILKNESIENLDIGSTLITDVELEILSKSTTLKELRIKSNRITLNCLNHFIGGNLEEVFPRTSHIPRDQLRQFLVNFENAYYKKAMHIKELKQKVEQNAEVNIIQKSNFAKNTEPNSPVELQQISCVKELHKTCID